MSAEGHGRLVLMANQIARNMAAMEGAHAAAAVADHIASFWDPRMKAAILADRAGLDPLAATAIEILAHAVPTHANSAAAASQSVGTPPLDAG